MSKKPDLFDSYSAGITMLMLCVPQLSKVNAVKSVRKTLGATVFFLCAMNLTVLEAYRCRY